MVQTTLALFARLQSAVTIRLRRFCVQCGVSIEIGAQRMSPPPAGRGLKPFFVNTPGSWSSPTSGPGMRMPRGSDREDG